MVGPSGILLYETMSLWVDKHRPTSLAKLDYHKELSSHLKKLVGVNVDIIIRLIVLLGSQWRYSSFIVLWTIWCWQEDEDNVCAQGALWQRC